MTLVHVPLYGTQFVHRRSPRAVPPCINVRPWHPVAARKLGRGLAFLAEQLMIERDYLVVGAGTAGVSVCEGIRLHDKRGKITLVGNEVHPPYARPVLSKKFLSQKDFNLESTFHHPLEDGTRNKRLTCA